MDTKKAVLVILAVCALALGGCSNVTNVGGTQPSTQAVTINGIEISTGRDGAPIVLDDQGNVLLLVPRKTVDENGNEITVDYVVNGNGEVVQVSDEMLERIRQEYNSGKETTESDADETTAADGSQVTENGDPNASAWDAPYNTAKIEAECREYAESLGLTWFDRENGLMGMTMKYNASDEKLTGDDLKEAVFREYRVFKSNGCTTVSISFRALEDGNYVIFSYGK